MSDIIQEETEKYEEYALPTSQYTERYGLSKGNPCAICGTTINVGPHHIKPKAEGGTDEERNIVYLCNRCHDLVEGVYQDIGMEYCPSVVRTVKRMIDIYEGRINVMGSQKEQAGRRHKRHTVFLREGSNGRGCPIAGIHRPAVPTRDTLTGKVYRSKGAVGRALAEENGLDSADHFVYYRLTHMFPNRFVNA